MGEPHGSESGDDATWLHQRLQEVWEEAMGAVGLQRLVARIPERMVP